MPSAAAAAYCLASLAACCLVLLLWCACLASAVHSVQEVWLYQVGGMEGVEGDQSDQEVEEEDRDSDVTPQVVESAVH